MAMRCLLLALFVVLALGAGPSAFGDWRTFGAATPKTGNRTSRPFYAQRHGGQRQTSQGQRQRDQAGWRNYGVANKTSPDGVWQRGYGRLGYGWYNVYGDYVGNDGYNAIGFGYRNRPSGFNFNRTDNYGLTDPRTIGERPR
jgi:hypothetical protein